VCHWTHDCDTLLDGSDIHTQLRNEYNTYGDANDLRKGSNCEGTARLDDEFYLH